MPPSGCDTANPGLDLTGVDLTDAKFDHAQCVACNFTSADLTGVAFDDAYLPGAQLKSVDDPGGCGVRGGLVVLRA